MLRDMNISDTRKNLMKMPEMLAEDQGAVAVTRGGKPVLAVMSWELYESITETLEILSDEEMMDSLRQGVKEAEAEMGISWEEAKRLFEKFRGVKDYARRLTIKRIMEM